MIMEIKRPVLSIPATATTTGNQSTGAVKSSFTDKLASSAPAAPAAPVDAASVMERLLDRAAERMGGIPEGARAALRTQLESDPFFQARLKMYLEKQGV